MEATSGRGDGARYAKWALFAALGILTVVAVANAERFLIDPHDPEWAHIAPFGGCCWCTRWPASRRSLPDRGSSRGACGARICALHRTIGRVYVVAALIASSMGMYLGTTHEPWPLNAQQPAQAGGWLLSTVIPYVAIRNGHVALHRLWMARSYAFTFVFVASRLPFPSSITLPSLRTCCGGSSWARSSCPS